MTAIVAFVDKNKTIWMGGDRCQTGYDVTTMSSPKIWITDGFIFGGAGSSRDGQILRHYFTPPDVVDDDLERYFVTTFVPHLRNIFTEQKRSKVENEIDKGNGAYFLCGTRGRIFQIYYDYTVSECIYGIEGIGSGGALAKGAVAVMANTQPKKKILKALEIAERYEAGVCKPFDVLSLEYNAT